MTTALLLAAALLGQTAHHITGTITSVADDDQWCLSRGHVADGWTMSLDTYHPAGSDVGNVTYRIGQHGLVPGRGYLVGDSVEFGAGGPGRIHFGAAPLAGGESESLLIWDGVPTDPPRPSYSDCRLAVSWTAAEPRLIGDSTLDGLFDSSDLIAVFVAGQYEDATPDNSAWHDGDWNADGDFDTSDLIAAMATGTYEQPPEAVGVPEPSAAVFVLSLSILLPAISRGLR